jgi:aminoglycoside 2''-phosphotransferase
MLDWAEIGRECGLRVRSTHCIGEGWNSRAFLVNDELVFRFSKSAAQWPEIDREMKFLAWAADRLPLAVPRYEQATAHSPACPSGYAVYRYLPGQPMDIDAMSTRSRTEAAECLATFLRTLHALQPSDQLGALLPRDDPHRIAEERLTQVERKIARALAPAEARAIRRLSDAYLNTRNNFTFEPVVLHADFSGDHLLSRESLVVGVLDFGDVNWGDADYDFHYLFMEFGDAFATEIARRYGHPDPLDLVDKLRYFSVCDQAETILDGGARSLPGQVERAWRHLRELLEPMARTS